jgi:acyl-CoA hydrolase
VSASLDQATAWARSGDGSTGTVDQTWMQGRGAFGGVVAGLAVRALEHHVSRPLRSLDGAFLGPLIADTQSRVEVEVLREGRSVTFATARVRQGDRLVARFTGVFGEARPSGIQVPVRPTGAQPPRIKSHSFEHVPGVPAFIQHLDIAYAGPHLPFTGQTEPGVACWCRFREPATGAAGLVALADAPPPAVLPMLQKPAPASTVRWSVTLLGEPRDAHAGDFWYRSTCIHAADGYATIEGHLYTADGLPVAWMEQLVAVFDG